MAWTDVRLTKDSFADKGDGSASAERVYYAKADAYVTGDAALAASFGGVAVPAQAAGYSVSRPYCRVTDRKVERLSPTQFNITVTYAAEAGGEAEAEEDLLAAAARISQSADNTLEAYTVDAEGVQVRNKAGEPFDTFPERLGPGRTYTIRKYVNAATKAQIEAAERTTNNAAKTIAGRSHAIDTLLLAEASFEEEGTIWLTTLVIRYQPGGWADKALNVGFTEIVSSASKAITVDDGTGKQIPTPRAWPLNLDGTKKTNADDTAEVLTFYPYPLGAWTGVPLA